MKKLGFANRNSLKFLTLVSCLLIIFQNISPAQNSNEDIKTMQQTNNYENFKNKILSFTDSIEKRLDCRFGIAFKDKNLPVEFSRLGDERFHAASTMKVPVMIEVFNQAEHGVFSMNDEILVDPVCKSFLEDTTFICDSGEYLAERLHKKVTVRILVEQMIVASDNLATNILIAKCGYRKINSTMRKLGAMNGFVLRGVQDEPAYLAGLSNRMTPKDLNILIEAIDRDNAGSHESCSKMRKILLAQRYNSMIPALLPKEVKVAHKTGSITAVRHDTGIVYAPFGAWYLTILMDNLKDESAGIQAAAELSLLIYNERKKLQ